MCFPMLLTPMVNAGMITASTASTLATVGQVASMAMPIISGFQQAKAAKAEGAYNARLKENEATRVANKGVDEENKHRQQVALMLEQQKTQFAAKGVELGTGSPGQVLQSTVQMGEADARRIRENYQLESQALEDEAEGIRIAAKNKAKSAILGGITSGLASAVSAKWYGPDSFMPKLESNLIGPRVDFDAARVSSMGRIA